MSKRRGRRDAAGPTPVAPESPPATRPDFFADFTVSRAKLNLLRVGFFACVALDAFLQISHAPRYGAAGFNVAHLPILDAMLPSPTRPVMLTLFLLQAYLAALVVFGVGTRWAVTLLAGLYGYTYFISQLDSYQHHYLVFLLLLVACFVPWKAAAKDAPAEPTGDPGTPVRSWALRLILVQMSILYFWAAIAKLSPAWLDGTTLSKQLLVPWVRDIVSGLPGTFTTAAVAVALVELALAVLLCFRRAWPIALGLGLGLHAGIELAGFKIGIFSYFMFALYTLLLPDRLLVSVAEMVASGLAPVRQAVARMAGAASEGVRFAAVAVLCLAAGGLALAWLPFAEGRVVAVAAVVVAAADIALAARGRRRAALHTATSHLVASALLFGLVAWTDDAFDYYRFWGGSARRLENDAEAVAAYTGLTRVRPEYAQGHFFLGASLHQQGKTAEALASFRRAQEAVPPDPRAFTGEAVLQNASGNGPAAIAAAEKALSHNPNDRAARAILDRWRVPPQQP